MGSSERMAARGFVILDLDGQASCAVALARRLVTNRNVVWNKNQLSPPF